MAKILVADDNSNIQKMVGLALKDQGIDVVAVGNGEAAVRKISDVRPDLVLADVFMPVRNGYEVCQYVKGDDSLAHIPVILLVGAFDPLDEQEAQRVGADGVLKKPFVPPDPLISMVKSALARAGVSVGGAVPAPVHEEPVRVAEMLTPRSTPSPAASYGAQQARPEFPAVESEPVQEMMPATPEPVKIEAGSGPLAFGNLLDTETEAEDDAAYATTARPELERDWKSGEEDEDEVEEAEDEKGGSSWRRDAGQEEVETEEAAKGPEKDWREEAFSEAAPARKSKLGPWSPQKEISPYEEAAETEAGISAMVKETAVAETKPATPETAPFTQESWAATMKPKNGVEAATMEAPPPPPVPVVQEERIPEPVRTEPIPTEAAASAPAKTEVAPEPVKRETENSWFSSVPSPWEADAQKANQLASTWDEPAKKEPAPTPAPPAEVKAETIAPEVPKESFSEELKEKAEEAAIPEATVEAIREEAQHLTETAIAEVPAASSKSAEPSMDELVAKVLAKMSPEVLQAVTREILKPVVESMVRDELNAKK
ncbi:MAG TPA: response regulator [Candidatus Acidoferrum sp.]|nr:response regulator [Candidatus Acidoferrum sp.]